MPSVTGMGPRCRLVVATAALGVLALATIGARAEEITGRVVDVRSGDTLVVDAGGTVIEVRLADIDAPQGSAFYAPAARTLLASMVRKAPVRIAVTGRASDARVFGRVRAGELDVNLEMVRRGAAWVCLEFAATTDYLPYDSDARRFHRGLWSRTWEIDARAECLRRPPAAEPVSAPAAGNPAPP
jgi:endonuclease YncB( thermonuclease family)